MTTGLPIDLTAPHDVPMLPIEVAVARTVAELSATIGAVPGCHVSDMTDVQVTGTGSRRINLHVTGRSPSLHRQTWIWSTVVRIVGNGDSAILRGLADISDRLDLQRERADAAVALGHAFPLPMHDGYPPLEPIAIGHLTMDATALALRLNELPSGAPASGELHRLRALVRGIHRAVSDPAKRIAREDDAAVTDRSAADRRLDVRTLVPLPYGKSAHINGEMLIIPDASLPDTILATLPGRPLGDVISVHPLLDARIISKATNTPTSKGAARVRVTLKPCRVALSEVFDMEAYAQNDSLTVREVRDRLAALIDAATAH